MTKRTNKRGDTLIEVMLAVGIFSMVAVAVVSVMSGGTSSAQTALETTLTRGEIDIQTEALRFIQASCVGEKDRGEGKFCSLWKNIIDRSLGNNDGTELKNIIENYPPDNCDSLYGEPDDPGQARKYGFVIDTTKLEGDSLDDALKNGATFQIPSTYPHLVYGTDRSLQSVDGIYTIAVKGDDDGTYYDFYVRTCWYGTSDRVPSTTSTIIRLYNPLQNN